MKILHITDIHNEATRDFLFAVKCNCGVGRTLLGDIVHFDTAGGSFRARKGDWVVEFDNGYISKVPAKIGFALAASLSIQQDERAMKALAYISDFPTELPDEPAGHWYQGGISDIADFTKAQNVIY